MAVPNEKCEVFQPFACFFPNRILVSLVAKGGAHTRQCTMKVLLTKGGLWPPQESCYFGGVQGFPPHRAKRAVVHMQGGA